MTVKQRIKDFLENKDSATLQEIYIGLSADGIIKNNIRSILNISVKHNGIFERISRGAYKLKQPDTPGRNPTEEITIA